MLDVDLPLETQRSTFNIQHPSLNVQRNFLRVSPQHPIRIPGSDRATSRPRAAWPGGHNRSGGTVRAARAAAAEGGRGPNARHGFLAIPRRGEPKTSAVSEVVSIHPSVNS